MQSVVEMEDSIVYQTIIRKGLDQGFAQGRYEGREQGREEGILLGEVRLLLKLAGQRFGPPTDAVRQRVSAAATDEKAIDGLLSRLASAGSWDELLADEHR